MTVGAILRRLRERSGMKQEEVARRAHITQGTYSLYEADKTRPKIQTLSRLADIYGVSVAVIDHSLKLPSGAPPKDADADPLLAIIVDAWPELTPEDRGRLAGIASGMLDAKKTSAG